uniref:Uncharacterized protein n=1 Tax=Oryza nivara TaxID=4536 RepID=A0A0E0HC65_ORYNI
MSSSTAARLSAEVARSREEKMSEDSPATSSSGLSHIALLRMPSMEEEEEDGELLMVDMEMANEDELLSLNDGGKGHEWQFYLIIRWRSENDFENVQRRAGVDASRREGSRGTVGGSGTAIFYLLSSSPSSCRRRLHGELELNEIQKKERGQEEGRREG